MNMDQLFYTIFHDPISMLKTALRIVHFIGLALGLGAATVLDLMVVKFFIKDRVTHQQWELFDFGSQIVNGGLILLWASGIGFLAYYAAFDPAKLGNEKIWAKLTIVVILTVNGMLIHALVLPTVKAQIGRSLLEGLSIAERSFLLISGSISVTSWFVPLLLGATPQLNFVVPMKTILIVYGLFLAIALMVSHVLLLTLPAKAREPEQRRPQRARIDPVMTSLGLPRTQGKQAL